jgi:hypothetical protein
MGEMDARSGSATRDRLDHSDEVEDKARLDLAELMRLKGHLLAPEERTLLEAYLKGSNSLRQIARLAGMKPSSAWRRVRRLARRLHASASLMGLETSHGLTVEELAIVNDHVIRGLSMYAISRRRRLSYYRVRNIILASRALTRASYARPRRTPRRTQPASFQDRSVV